MADKLVSKEPNATPAMVRALEAVARGLIFHDYQPGGETFRAPSGISMQTIRDVQYRRWISDASERSGPICRVAVMLTPSGRAQVAAATYRKVHDAQKGGQGPVRGVQAQPGNVGRSALSGGRTANNASGRNASDRVIAHTGTDLCGSDAGSSVDAADEQAPAQSGEGPLIGAGMKIRRIHHLNSRKPVFQVLDRRRLVQSFPTLEAAREAYPGAEPADTTIQPWLLLI